MIEGKTSATAWRTGLVVALIGVALVAAVMEVRADLVSSAPPRVALRGQFDPVWKAHVSAIDQALSAHDVSAAVRAWHEAYGAALASRGWEGMIAVGDAFLKIGREARTTAGSRPNARQAYLTAIVRAHRDGSPEGLRRVAQAFAALGDHAVAAQCLRVADELAAARERI